MDVIESDHKPVRCKFNVEIAHVDRSIRREELGKIIESNEEIKTYLNGLRSVPDILLSHYRIVLQNQETFNLRITNRSRTDKAFYQIVCQGQSTIKEDEKPSEHHPRGSYGFPRWLEVNQKHNVLGLLLFLLCRRKNIMDLCNYCMNFLMRHTNFTFSKRNCYMFILLYKFNCNCNGGLLIKLYSCKDWNS